MKKRLMKKLGVVAAAVVWSVLHPLVAWSAPLPDRDAQINVSVPLSSTAPPNNPMVLDIWRKSAANPNKLVKSRVVIDDLPKFTPPAPTPFVRPAPLFGETLIQYNFRVQVLFRQWQLQQVQNNKAAWEAASKDKADRIAAKINAALGAGTAMSTQVDGGVFAGFKNGRVDITNVHRVQYGQIKKKNGQVIPSNNTGEVGDGTRIKKGSPGGNSMLKGSMGSLGSNGISASGLDEDGNQSVVEFGIQDIYVASWFPAPGETFDEVLLGLESLLDMNGLAATFDPGLGLLSLDGNFGDLDTFVWSMSDTGLNGSLGFEYGVIPEPETLALLGAAMAASGMFRRRSFSAARPAA